MGRLSHSQPCPCGLIVIAVLGRNKYYLCIRACQIPCVHVVLAHGEQGICTAPDEPERQWYVIRMYVTTGHTHN